MSLIDTIAPALFAGLFGLAAVIGVVSWAGMSLVPRMRQINAARAADQAVLDYNRKAHDLVTLLLSDPANVLEQDAQDQLWELQGLHITATPRKGLR